MNFADDRVNCTTCRHLTEKTEQRQVRDSWAGGIRNRAVIVDACRAGGSPMPGRLRRCSRFERRKTG